MYTCNTNYNKRLCIEIFPTFKGLSIEYNTRNGVGGWVFEKSEIEIRRRDGYMNVTSYCLHLLTVFCIMLTLLCYVSCNQKVYFVVRNYYQKNHALLEYRKYILL